MLWCSALNDVLMLIVTFMMCCQLALYKAQQSHPRLELIAYAATTGPNSDFSNCIHYYSGSSMSWYEEHATCHAQGLTFASVPADVGAAIFTPEWIAEHRVSSK